LKSRRHRQKPEAGLHNVLLCRRWKTERQLQVTYIKCSNNGTCGFSDIRADQQTDIQTRLSQYFVSYPRRSNNALAPDCTDPKD